MKNSYKLNFVFSPRKLYNNRVNNLIYKQLTKKRNQMKKNLVILALLAFFATGMVAQAPAKDKKECPKTECCKEKKEACSKDKEKKCDEKKACTKDKASSEKKACCEASKS